MEKINELVGEHKNTAAQKCLIVTNHADAFGRHKRYLFEGMENDFTFLIASGAGDRAVEFDFTEISVKRKLVSIPSDFKLIGQLYRLLRDYRPDRAVFFTMKVCVFGAFATLLSNSNKPGFKPVFYLPGLGLLFEKSGVASRTAKTLAVKVFSAASEKFPNATFMFENRTDADKLAKAAGLSGDQVIVLNGTGVENPPVDIDKKFSFAKAGGNRLRIVWACRLVRGKGLDFYVDLARELERRLPSCFLFEAYGLQDPQSPEAISDTDVRRMIENSPVIFKGEATHLPDVLSSSDVLVHPSRYLEGLPRVILEAASYACTIVATANPGTRAFVEHGKTGLLKEADDLEGFCQALAELHEDRKLLVRLAANAKSRLHEDGFDQDSVKAAFQSALR